MTITAITGLNGHKFDKKIVRHYRSLVASVYYYDLMLFSGYDHREVSETHEIFEANGCGCRLIVKFTKLEYQSAKLFRESEPCNYSHVLPSITGECYTLVKRPF